MAFIWAWAVLAFSLDSGAQTAWKTLTALSFPADEALEGWVTNPDRGTVGVDGETLRIASRSGKGQEWASNTITYGNGFLLKDATVRLDVDVASQNVWRDAFVGLTRVEGGLHRDPAVWVNISNGHDSRVQIRQMRKSSPATLLAPELLPFKFDRNVRVSLTVAGADVSLAVSRGDQRKDYRFEGLIPEQWLIHRFTFLIGTSQHGNPSDPATIRLSRVALRTTKSDELSVEEMTGNGPGRSDEVRYIYLEGAANRHFDDKTPGDGIGGWTDQGSNDMRFIPRGYQFFRNVPFYVVDKLAVVGNEPLPGCVLLKGKHTEFAPLESAPVKVGARARFLYFLHTCAWGAPDGTKVAEYVVRYEDGAREVIDVRTGFGLRDWWEPKECENAKVAWVGKNLVKGDVGCYILEWPNPRPETPVRDVTFRSAGEQTTPVLIALTASDDRIAVGPRPRRFSKPLHTLCEYRQRPKTSLVWAGGAASVRVWRKLPIAAESEVRQAEIEVLRYRPGPEAAVQCRVGNVVKTAVMPQGRIRARFLFTEPDVLGFLTEEKGRFPIDVTLPEGDGVGTFVYETNPNLHWVPGGQDGAGRVHAVTGVFQVTAFLPVHQYSGYVELKPSPVEARAAERREAAFSPAANDIDWLGSRLCLNGIWDWQPGPPGKAVPQEIPDDGWESVRVPADVGARIFEYDQECVGAWFRKELDVPAGWAGRRIVLHFRSVTDFATVYCNGRKVAYHEGLLPFDVDLTPHTKGGSRNTIHLYCQNVYAGISLHEVQTPVARLVKAGSIAPLKGHAYRMTLVRGAWDQKPDEIRLLLDGRDTAVKSSRDQVVTQGDGRYFREQEWNRSILTFSTPGNVDLEAVKGRLTLCWNAPGTFEHFGRGDAAHHWRNPRWRETGPWQDVFLDVSGRTRVRDVFVRTSVQRMALDVDVEVAGVPAGGVVLGAQVRDGAEIALDLGERQVGDGKVVLSSAWPEPRLWHPSDPYLYHLVVELREQGTGALLDRQIERFGFREFRIDGPDFVFNDTKPFIIQGTSIGANHLPFHRHHVRWHFADYNQQANINMIRFHIGGLFFADVLDVADEMGMLVCQEGSNTLDHPEWTQAQVRYQRNHPSVVMWSTDNERGVVYRTKDEDLIAETAEKQMRLNAAVNAVDPTRPTVNNGGHVFVYTDRFKDPRVQIVDGHYLQPRTFSGWKKKVGKPCTAGEVSCGGPWAWTYQNVKQRLKDKALPEFWASTNAATRYMGARIQAFQGVELAGIWPFGPLKGYHPFMLSWEGVEYWQPMPGLAWPAESGEGVKRESVPYGRDTFNFFDPKAPRTIHLRPYDALKQHFEEAPKLEPRLSPEVIVRVVDRRGNPVPDRPVWLVPTSQPATVSGVITDSDGRAWFCCRAGGGDYLVRVRHDGAWYEAPVVPAPVGEWMQVKVVTARLP